ncbi:hypothetical protein [uncultured Kocuria sp.]|uniref:hypothetical protein n=1 Tax=uncultured Kocuria sp. TaxID=259305 RepID=UPI0025931C4F|nr:hypothetical protein [uncultured Kocuria sp.]MCT1366533.1 hypothetical protein [Rothia sp. p3-SID1597]
MTRICLVSGGDEIRQRSYINHAIYAREHGLDYRLECGIDPQIVTKYDYKMSIVRRLIHQYDWLVWIDDDAYFTDFESDTLHELVEEAERDDQFLVIAEGPLEPNGFWSKINTGVFLIKNCPESVTMLESMSSEPLETIRDWWDDEAYGLFTNGDQDQMWWYLCTTGLLDRTKIVGHRRLNSRGHYYENSLDDAFVMHFCGYPDKAWGAARFARRFPDQIGQELVPKHLLDKYSVAVRDPLGPTQYSIRDTKIRSIGAVKKRLRPLVHAWRERKSTK